MNQKNNNKQEEGCPLCETTKEAVDMLNTNKDSKIKDKKLSRKTKTIFWCLVIIFGMIGGYKILSNSPPTNSIAENNLIQGQSINTSEKNEKARPQINAPAPDFISEDVYGNKISLSDFRGKKPVLLVFWATWCGYCAKEKDDLKTFTKRYQDKIQVLAVDGGEPKQTIRDYIGKENINFLILLDEQRKIWNQYLIRGTPSHFLIDKQGKIITMRPGLASLADLETMLSMIPKE